MLQIRLKSNIEYRTPKIEFGRLAQSGERFLHTEEVIGSIPVSPTSYIKAFSFFDRASINPVLQRYCNKLFALGLSFLRGFLFKQLINLISCFSFCFRKDISISSGSIYVNMAQEFTDCFHVFALFK